MQTFNEYRKNTESIDNAVQALLFLSENNQYLELLDTDVINESTEQALNEDVQKHLKKAGLKIHKSKGILDYIKTFAVGTGKVFFYILTGKNEKAKELLKTVKKEDVLDFLYKLDLGTLHLVTGPLHFIDAWTGWDLAVNMESHIKKGAGLTDLLKDALIKVKNTVEKLYDDVQSKVILGYVKKIEQVTVL